MNTTEHPVLSREQFRKVTLNALRAHKKYRGKSRRAIALYAISRSMNCFERIIRHFLLVAKHKTFVLFYCCYAGYPWRGFAHDWSKYSLDEFVESVRFFNGRRSPVGLARELEGYSFAWLHHKGRNKHHFEFWSDVVDSNGVPASEYGRFYPLPTPFPYALEMICDMIAASRAYNGKRFSYKVLYDWSRKRTSVPLNMHPSTRRFFDAIFQEMYDEGNCKALRRAKAIFMRAQEIRPKNV